MFEHSRWLNHRHFDQAHVFYQRYGDKALFLSRFLPVVRSLVPFIAGAAHMNSTRFMKFNVLSVIMWVLSIVLLTYYLGHLPVVKKHFSWIVLGIAGLALVAFVVGSIRWAVHRARR